MSLLDVTFAGVETAFAVAMDFVSVGDYLARSGAEVYDPDTNTKSPQGTTIPNVRFLPTAVTAEERESSPISVDDIKVLVPGKDLGTTRPTTNDKFYMSNIWYNVVSVKPVPGKALWIIFGRRA